MRNGTTFRLTSAAPHEVLEMAMHAAGGPDVLLGDGERIFGHTRAARAESGTAVPPVRRTKAVCWG